MRQALVSLFPMVLAACFPFKEGLPDATEDQVREILDKCDIERVEIEPQPEGEERLVVSLSGDEQDGSAKKRCLLDAQESKGVGFTIFGG